MCHRKLVYKKQDTGLCECYMNIDGKICILYTTYIYIYIYIFCLYMYMYLCLYMYMYLYSMYNVYAYLFVV